MPIMRPGAQMLLVATVLGACSNTDGSLTEAAARPSLAMTNGFKTSKPLEAVAMAGGVELEALLTVGDFVASVEWAPAPDGLGAFVQQGQLVVFANHELASSDGYPGYLNAMVSRIALNPDLTVSTLSYPIDGTEGWQRLCSATWIGAQEGFGYPGYFLTGEETSSGRQFAVDANGNSYQLTGQGKYAHENALAVPGFAGKKVIINLDDSRGASELYMYVAADAAGVLDNTGTLYVFASSEAKNVKELIIGAKIRGEFVPVPTAIATGSGAGLQSWVTARSWNGQSAPDPAVYAGTPIFPFVRLEDGDYDRNPSGGPTIYFVDTGTDRFNSGTSSKCGAAANELCDAFGSIYRMTFDRDDPTKVTLELMARSAGEQTGWASPDNIALSRNSLMVQEDPAYDGFSRPARIYQFPLTGSGLGTPRAIVEMVEDADGCGPGAECFESSGIIDVSEFYGAGTWLFDVQAHGKEDIPGIPNGGQLIFMRVAGS